MEGKLVVLCAILTTCVAQEQYRNYFMDQRNLYGNVPLYTDASRYVYPGFIPYRQGSQMMYGEDFARQASEKNNAKETIPHSATSTNPAPSKNSPVNPLNSSASEYPQIDSLWKYLDTFGLSNDVSHFDGRSSAGEYDPYYVNGNNYFGRPDLLPHTTETQGAHSTTSHLPASENAMPLLVTALKGLTQGGIGSALATSALTRLPGVLLKGLLVKAASTLVKSGVKGLIAKILVPLLVLVGVDVLIVILSWWLWDDSSCVATSNHITHVPSYQPY